MNEPKGTLWERSTAVRFCRWFFSWPILRRTLLTVAVLATLIAVFYAEENWRGKRAWEQCKRELEAKGEVLDWSAYIPPPVPDDQNFYKAPGITESDWVWRGFPPLYKRLQGLYTNYWESVSTNKSGILIARLKVAPNGGDLPRYESGETFRLSGLDAHDEASNVIRQIVGPSVVGSQGFTYVARLPAANRTPQIILRSARIPSVQELQALFPEKLSSSLEVTSLPTWTRVRIQPAGSNEFDLTLGAPPVAASDFLSRAEPFETEVEQIRKALDRPYARLTGDYTQPYAIPIQNFVLMRVIAQTFTDRARCFLLLDEPGNALRELTLVHQACRLLESRPAGKPMKLLAAMIRSAVVGLYVDTIGEGFRLGMWRESELVLLQKQLEDTQLLPQVYQAFRHDRIAFICTMENTPPSQEADHFLADRAIRPNAWERFRDPVYSFRIFAPRGWVYRNMVASAVFLQPIIDTYDITNQLVLPQKANEALQLVIKLQSHWSPYTWLTTWSLPNYVRAWQSVARNQSQVSEAFVACALERYRLAHGEYPESLEALVPQFADKLPHDVIGGRPLKYRRTGDGHFLLYSVGWNETDDGGLEVRHKDGRDDLEKGDWVWGNYD